MPSLEQIMISARNQIKIVHKESAEQTPWVSAVSNTRELLHSSESPRVSGVTIAIEEEPTSTQVIITQLEDRVRKS